MPRNRVNGYNRSAQNCIGLPFCLGYPFYDLQSIYPDTSSVAGFIRDGSNRWRLQRSARKVRKHDQPEKDRVDIAKSVCPGLGSKHQPP